VNTHIWETTVEAAKPPASGYIILFDDKLDGFGIRVTAAGKVFKCISIQWVTWQLRLSHC
jgi:hypothetical protein